LASASAHLNGKDVGFDAADEESCDTLDEDDHGMVNLNWWESENLGIQWDFLTPVTVESNLR